MGRLVALVLGLALAGLLGALAVSAQPPAPLRGAAPPVVTRVEPVDGGYAIVGSGFGADPVWLQVYEGKTPINSAAIVSVADDRIVVRSAAEGAVEHRVVIGGQTSNTVGFTHPRAQARSLALSRPKSRTFIIPSMTMTGLRPQPVTLMIGQMTMTGLRPQVPMLTLNQMTMTGLRPLPPMVTLGQMTMTGLRSQTALLTLGEMTMVGLRPQPAMLTTGEMTMTGLR